MLEIGEKVSWYIKDFKMIGVVLEDKGNTVKLMCHFRGEMPCTQQMEVKKELLTKE